MSKKLTKEQDEAVKAAKAYEADIAKEKQKQTVMQEIEWEAAEIVTMRTLDQLDEIKRIKRVASDPYSAGFSAFKGITTGKEIDVKIDREKTMINPKWQGQITNTAGYQLQQVRELMCNDLFLDESDKLINSQFIDGVEENIQMVMDGALQDEKSIYNGEMHYDLLFRKLKDLSDDHEDIYGIYEAAREAKIMAGFCKAYQIEKNRLIEKRNEEVKESVIVRAFESLQNEIAALKKAKKKPKAKKTVKKGK